MEQRTFLCWYEHDVRQRRRIERTFIENGANHKLQSPAGPVKVASRESRSEMPPGPSRTGTKGYNPPAKVAFMPAMKSDLLADMRQVNVSFGVAIAKGDKFFAKSVHERVER